MVGVLYRMVSHIEILQNSNEWFYLHVFYGKLWTLIQHSVTDVVTKKSTDRKKQADNDSYDHAAKTLQCTHLPNIASQLIPMPNSYNI